MSAQDTAPTADPVAPPAPATAADDRIDPTFRNGTITAFGIIVSFSLGFLSQWASSPGVWRLYDTPPALAIFIGAALQTRALALLLPVNGLEKRIYEKATKTFLIGMILTGCGVFGAVAADALSAVAR
ncbi:hypothetical protein [Methylopila sp. M107]|uniref:hypothetical protein n=1 Tax=Methylopila sp. M107 TaxID=1101190 RepID=UPI00035E8EDD|nr:hypothetical protein [Methylopila sp. M107]